ALAFRRAGARDRADETWKRLAAAASDGITVGDRTISLDDLEKALNRPAGARAEVPAEALLPEAGWRAQSHSPRPESLIAPPAAPPVAAPAGAPLGPLVQLTAAARLSEPNALAVPLPLSPGAVWLAEAVRRLEAASQPVLPAATPLVVGNKVVWRGLR